MRKFALLAVGIFVLATAALWLVVMPDEPDVALGESTGAALVAFSAVLGRWARDRR